MKIFNLTTGQLARVNRWKIYFYNDSGPRLICDYSAKNLTAEQALKKAIQKKKEIVPEYSGAYVSGLWTHAETKPVHFIEF